MPQFKHIVIVAGEESGDAHAAELIRDIQQNHQSIKITGVGGQHMQSANVELIHDLASYGVTGISEVFRHFKMLYQAFKRIKGYLKNTRPDLLILVDSPGFNLRLAKYAKEKLGLTIIYYISPQIWAWKAKRINHIRRYIDHMAVILPFEKEIYQKAKIPVSFVGHPVTHKVNQVKLKSLSPETLGLPTDKLLIAILPGSRHNEVERHMPVLSETMQRLNSLYPNLHFAIPVAKTIKNQQIQSYIPGQLYNYTLVAEHSLEIVSLSHACIVASGTASLECALLSKPMCIIYRASWLTFALAVKLIKVKYIGLCNLLQKKMVVPELLQYDCNPKELTIQVQWMLSNKAFVNTMVTELNELYHSLSSAKADVKLSDLIGRYLFERNVASRTQST